MNGSTLTALAANPSSSVVCLLSSVFCHPSSFVYRPILLFVPLRFAIIFYSKIPIIESTPTPPCHLMTDYLISRLSFFVRCLSSVARLLSSVIFCLSSNSIIRSSSFRDYFLLKNTFH